MNLAAAAAIGDEAQFCWDSGNRQSWVHNSSPFLTATASEQKPAAVAVEGSWTGSLMETA
jgi:hypothetical protein